MRLTIGPLPLDALSLDGFLSVARDRIDRRVPSQIVTLNALMFNMALRDASLAGVLGKAAFVVPDSAGISWAAHFLCGNSVNRLPGIDLIHHFCELAAREGKRVFLLGAAPGVAEAAAERLSKLYPGLIISGTQHGYISKDEEASAIKRVAQAAPDILFVALAIPRQETWIADNLKALGVPLVMGVGGSFDVISGRLKRAPAWLSKTGFEWLYRTLQQPWRIRRILDLPVFVLNIFKIKFNAR